MLNARAIATRRALNSEVQLESHTSRLHPKSKQVHLEFIANQIGIELNFWQLVWNLYEALAV